MNKQIRCLISAGPTREWLDPVRFISNPSSGKMGYALSREAYLLGMEVKLISGPSSLEAPNGVKIVYVETALEMEGKINNCFPAFDIIIMAAAVCDYRPEKKDENKIKKSQFPTSMTFIPNPDILFGLGKKKSDSQILVGFAAETENHLENAKKKLKEKNLDWIVMNEVSKASVGFQSDFNKVTMLSNKDQCIDFGFEKKELLAKKILEVICP